MSTKTPQLRGRIEVSGELLRLGGSYSSDVADFEAAVAADNLETALGAYGGALLEGFELSGAAGFDEWLLMRRERLESAHRRATRTFAQHLERRGEWRRALELLRSLLERDDLEERTHTEVMRLHDLLGEREAALLQFEHCRNVLRRELGLEPLPETIQLAERIRNPQLLRSDPARTAMDASWWLPTHAPLIGRAAVWEGMRGAWAAGQVIFLSGEPGIGKTRLLLEFAASQGEYLLNAARPGDTIAPYNTATRTITDLLERCPPPELPPWVRRELSKLVPDLSDQPPPAVGSLEQRQRLFSAFVELVLLALKDAPAPVIDDLQFFDSASLALGLHAAQRLAEGGKRVLVAFRRGELQVDTQALLEQLLSNGQGVLIELEALQQLDTLALVRGLSGSSDATLCEPVWPCRERIATRTCKATRTTPSPRSSKSKVVAVRRCRLMGRLSKLLKTPSCCTKSRCAPSTSQSFTWACTAFRALSRSSNVRRV